MSRYGTVVLAFLVCLAAVYVWLDRPASPDLSARSAGPLGHGPGTPAPAPLLRFDPLQVTDIRLIQGDAIRAAQREGATWHPPPAERLADDFLRAVAELPIIHEITTASTNLRDFGLEPPYGTVELETTGDTSPLVLQIGDRNPPGSCVYVRLGPRGRVVLAGVVVRQDFDHFFAALGR